MSRNSLRQKTSYKRLMKEINWEMICLIYIREYIKISSVRETENLNRLKHKRAIKLSVCCFNLCPMNQILSVKPCKSLLFALRKTDMQDRIWIIRHHLKLSNTMQYSENVPNHINVTESHFLDLLELLRMLTCVSELLFFIYFIFYKREI